MCLLTDCTKLYALSVITPEKKIKTVSGEILSFLSRFLCSEINLPADLCRPYNLIARITLITKTQSWLLLPALCDHKSAGIVFTADHL